MGADLSWRPGPECLEHWAKFRAKIQANPTVIKPQLLAHERAALLEEEVIRLKSKLQKLSHSEESS